MEKQIDINYSIHNRFDIKVFDAKTNKLKYEAEAYNVVTDYLFDVILNNTEFGMAGGGWFGEICVGSGTGTPSASDTNLFHKEYSSSSWNFNDSLDNAKRYEYNNGVFSVKASIIIPTLTLVGVNITEVGIVIPYQQGRIATHAMLKDLSGNQISILKTDTDVIQIIATVYVHVLNNQEESFLPLFTENNYSNSLIVTLLGGGLVGETFSIHSCYTDPYKRFPRRRDLLFKNQSNIPKVNLGLINHVVTDETRMQPISLGSQITSKLFICDKENRQIRCSYRVNAEYWNITEYYGNYLPEYYTYGSRFLQIFQFNGIQESIHLNYKQFFTPQPIIKEAIGTGDGVTQVFSTKYPCINLNGQVYINNNLSSGYFIDYEPYACSMRGNGYFHKLQDANSDIVYTGYFSYKTFNQHVFWFDCERESYMQTYNYTKDTYRLDSNLEAVLYIRLPSNNFPYYTDALSGDENGNIKLSGILFTCYYRTIKLIIEGSNNLTNWTTISNEITLHDPQRIQFQPYSYIRFKILESVDSSDKGALKIIGLDKEHGQIGNIYFPTPPAPGDIITATYTPDCIPKDDQHVFDIDITYNFNEYQGNQ